MNQQDQFRGKIVIITGAANGIGRAIAERFGAEGAHVVVNDVGAEGAEAVARAIVAAGGSALAVTADVSDAAHVDALFEATLARFGSVDVLVNNAGLTNTERHFLEADAAWWDRIIAVNLGGAFLCGRRAAQIMARKGAGVIINMSSGGATRAHRGNAAYDAAKGGVEALTRAMALDLAPYGIRVNCIVPGLIRTYDIPDELAAERGEVVPMRRLGSADDVAGPTLFLASDDARYVTGETLRVDGGVLVQQRSAPVDVYPIDLFPKVAGRP
jgi:3-oxoacyl-[acyl-carrier protein] reductase